MSEPVVSVLLTTYNRERFLTDAIESVLAQTLSDFEIIVSDNRSTDQTVAIAREYARRDPRIRVEINERNLGQFGNRNRAATHARGAFLKYHDSDDLMYPHCLSTMVSMMQAVREAGFGLSSGACWPGGPCPMLLTPRHAYQREFLGHGLFMCGPSGALFRREAFERLGGFEDFGAPSDYLFWLRACRSTNVTLFPADLFWYRTHAGQEFGTGAAARQYADLGRHVWAALAAPDCPLTPEERDQARRNVLAQISKVIVRDLKYRQFQVAAVRWASSPSVAEWIRYAGWPSRDPLAGTPLSDSGEFVMPPWPSSNCVETSEPRR